MIDYRAFHDELEKIGFNWEDMSRVLRLTKAKTMRMPRRLLQVGPVSVPTASLPAQRQALTAAIAGGQIPEAAGAAALRNLEHTGGKMLMPKGGTTAWLESMGMPREIVQGRNRKAMETLMRGHELDELAMRKFDPAYTAKATHMDPDVILRERNRLLTMPSEAREAVSEAMGPMRALEAPVLERATRGVTGVGLPYAGGPRLSRHARKRIAQRMKEITALPETPGIQDIIAAAQQGG